MDNGKEVFKAITEWEIITHVRLYGIVEAAKGFNIDESEVKNIRLRGIKDHQDIIRSHQDSIAELQQCMEGKIEPGKSSSGGSTSSQGDDFCSVCAKRGHKTTTECHDNGVGCYKCGKNGHVEQECNLRRVLGRGGGLCYYCGLKGYKSVCSLCGETGHLGKQCY